MRDCGILMHISSLPGPDGIGDLGREAYAFADFLHRSGMTVWQVLPMGPTGYGESPYQSTSVYAGNPMFISLDKLAEEGMLVLREEDRYVPEDPERVNFEEAKKHKMKLLRDAFFRSEAALKKEMHAFEQENPWVRDFAMFTAIKEHFGGQMWTQWPDRGLRFRHKQALQKAGIELSEEIHFHLWCQTVFARQWKALKDYCNSLGIKLFGDMPIYVAEDSADTWTHPQVFQLDRNREPKRVAGVPPDYFCADGQLWGNPLYRWDRLKLRNYDWWVDRMAHMGKMYDMVRVDHFIGFANYWSVPRGAENARGGKWVKGPGKALFETFRKELPGLHIVAEDLGEVNDRVKELVAFTGYPGMRVLTFAFGGEDENIHLPENISENTAYYTGTHDNTTAVGWAEAASDEEIKYAAQKIGFKTRAEAPWALIKAVYASRARIAMVPMQDVLELPAWATMNHPGIQGGNWVWRMKPGAATDEMADRLRALMAETGRGNAES